MDQLQRDTNEVPGRHMRRTVALDRAAEARVSRRTIYNPPAAIEHSRRRRRLALNGQPKGEWRKAMTIKTNIKAGSDDGDTIIWGC